MPSQDEYLQHEMDKLADDLIVPFPSFLSWSEHSFMLEWRIDNQTVVIEVTPEQGEYTAFVDGKVVLTGNMRPASQTPKTAVPCDDCGRPLTVGQKCECSGLTGADLIIRYARNLCQKRWCSGVSLSPQAIIEAANEINSQRQLIEEQQRALNQANDVVAANTRGRIAMQTEIEELRGGAERLHVPGMWFCRICDFTLGKNVLAPNGVFVDESDAKETCPNGCGVDLQRMTWEQHAKGLEKALDRMAKDAEQFKGQYECAVQVMWAMAEEDMTKLGTACEDYQGAVDAIMARRKDAERLDWLDDQANDEFGWVCRDSESGRGWRLHQSSQTPNYGGVREAIDAARAGEAGDD